MSVRVPSQLEKSNICDASSTGQPARLNIQTNGAIKSLREDSVLFVGLQSIWTHNLASGSRKGRPLLRFESTLRKLELSNLRDDIICPGIDVVFLYRCA